MLGDVRNVLITVILECGKNRVRRCLAETAEGVFLNVVAELFELIDVFECALAACNLVEDLKQALRADTARGALAAGFIDRELKEELAISTMQVVSSITMSPPEPIMEPMAMRLS